MVAGDEDCRLRSIGLEDGPQPRDVDPQRVLFALGIVAPELLEDAVRRDNTIGVENQQRQQRALLVGTEVQLRSFIQDLERSQNSVFHESHLPSNSTAA